MSGEGTASGLFRIVYATDSDLQGLPSTPDEKISQHHCHFQCSGKSLESRQDSSHSFGMTVNHTIFNNPENDS